VGGGKGPWLGVMLSAFSNVLQHCGSEVAMLRGNKGTGSQSLRLGGIIDRPQEGHQQPYEMPRVGLAGQ
jgi:hypothetical protein